MIEVFADASFFVALFNERDELHQFAVAWVRKYTGKTTTTCWVLTEFANYFAGHPKRLSVGAYLADLQADSQFAVLPADELQYKNGLQLYRSRPDKKWSLTDCISFAVMEQRCLTTALTADHHFEQAGFQILLK